VPVVPLVTTWSLPAAAQDAATAQALFEEGRSLVQQQQYERACPKFAESQRLGPASGTLLNLGECYAKLGKTASAWAAFKEAIPAAHSAGQADREQFAHERIAEIEGKLVRLAVKVASPPAPQLIVKRDGVVLGEAAWGTPVPVDPGPHVIEAAAPGKRAWTTTVDVRSEPSTEVVVPVLEAVPVDAGTSKPLLTQRNVGIGVAGLGVVAAAVGAVFGLGAISTNDSAKSHCRNGNLCDPTGLDELDSARGKATASTIFFVLGAAAIGGGAVLFFTAPNDQDKGAERTPAARATPKRTPAMALAPAVGLSSGGLELRGAW
jgi:tetratricopeptide (TPR) repeat protein